MGFTTLDIIVLFVYLAVVAAAGLWSAGRQEDTADYFLGGRSMPWWAVMFSVVATETSTLTFISIPAVAYGGNLTFLQITFGYILGRIVVSLIFLPSYYEGKLQTAYQFLEERFGAVMRNVTSSTFMITRLLADGVRLFATAIPLAIMLRLGNVMNGWSDLSIYVAAIGVIAAVTIVYTLVGGIKAVVWMDFMQMIVYIGGAGIAAWLMIRGIPEGWGGAMELARSENKLQVFNFAIGESFRAMLEQPYAFITAVVGGGVFSLASHGTDQLIVQRLLTTRDLRSSQKALIGSGLVVFGQFALFLMIGLLLYGFYGGVSADDLGLATTDEIFAKFIVEQMPTGLSGLIVASLFAAAMSSLSSSLNSLASSTALDLYKPYWGRQNTAADDLRASRYITVGWGLILTASAVVFAVLQLNAAGERPAVVELGLGIASYTYGGLLGAFLFGRFTTSADRFDAITGFFAGLIALLFMVKGPIQQLLPGQGLAIAWPWYTVVGSAIVVAVGTTSHWLRK